jgi:hypothetical protein
MTNEVIYRSTLEDVKSWLDSIITNHANELDSGIWNVSATGVVSHFNVIRKVLDITENEWIPSQPINVKR